MIDIQQVLEKATTRPWKYVGADVTEPPMLVTAEGETIAYVLREEDAHLAAKAVNAYESHLALIREMAEALSRLVDDPEPNYVLSDLAAARTALAKAAEVLK